MRKLFYLILTLLLLIKGIGAQAIEITITSPVASYKERSATLAVSGKVVSEYPIHFVRVKVGSVFGSASVNANGDFTGTMPRGNLPYDSALILTVVVRNTLEVTDSAQITFSFTHNIPPTVSILSPGDGDNVYPLAHVRIQLGDDTGLKMVAIKVSADYLPDADSYYQNNPAEIDTIMDFTKYIGKRVEIYVQGFDTDNRVTRDTIDVFVNGGPYLSKVHTIEGGAWRNIVDFNFDKIVTFNGIHTSVTDIYTKATYTMHDSLASYTVKATPRGVMYNTPHYIYEWNNGVLDSILTGSSFRIVGDSVLYSIAGQRVRKSLLTGQSEVIATGALAFAADTLIITTERLLDSSNGRGYPELVKYTRGQRFVLHSGKGNIGEIYYEKVITDGKNIVFCVESRIQFNSNRYRYHNRNIATWFLGNGGEPVADYYAKNNWVAYTNGEIILRDSVNREMPRTFDPYDGEKIEEMDDLANIVYVNSLGRYYIGRTETQPVKISTPLGKTYCIRNKWFVIIGNSIYEMNLRPTPYITINDGDWESPATWQGGIIPPDHSIIIIRSNVTCNSTVVCSKLSVESPGSMQVATGGRIIIMN